MAPCGAHCCVTGHLQAQPASHKAVAEGRGGGAARGAETRPLGCARPAGRWNLTAAARGRAGPPAGARRQGVLACKGLQRQSPRWADARAGGPPPPPHGAPGRSVGPLAAVIGRGSRHLHPTPSATDRGGAIAISAGRPAGAHLLASGLGVLPRRGDRARGHRSSRLVVSACQRARRVARPPRWPRPLRRCFVFCWERLEAAEAAAAAAVATQLGWVGVSAVLVFFHRFFLLSTRQCRRGGDRRQRATG